MDEIQRLQKDIEIFKEVIRSCRHENASASMLGDLIKKEERIEQLLRIKRSELAYFMRQKNWVMVVELHRVDENGGQEILDEMASFPVDVEGSYYEKGKRWTAENVVEIRNIEQFCPIEKMLEMD